MSAHGTTMIKKALNAASVKMRYGDRGEQIFNVDGEIFTVAPGLHTNEIIHALTAEHEQRKSANS